MMLDGKVAVVTGGASGIGAATALRLAEEGARVVLGDINADGLARVIEQITAIGGSAVGRLTDVSSLDDMQALATTAMQDFGRIDIWHNNAAAFAAEVIMQDFNAVEVDLAVWERTLSVNLTGALLGCRVAAPAMLEGGGGSIINMSSVAAWFPENTRVSYSVTKAAIVNLTKHVAITFGKQNVRCNAIAPGVVVTENSRIHMGDAWIKDMEKYHPSPSLIEPVDIANVVCFLGSELSRKVNGHVVVVDGGLTSRLSSSST
ncbi:MAG TPA: SDR family oxidoreductase [Ilumatobacteraceae bacterium]|jgi:NAD(P)-dependent dehydrogenase (short-subunit alcohol dehydrogenase family)